ncbi:type I-E CRISPR-associated protein Cas7/Cse4/CasC [Armatimonas sp.]|uniref:type I-E CRISPR-associated protein Cas7/Cse4/CasC n=1 Tax=Armatimonas sp. TaxID=1872638 RepID=UPI003752125C
MSTLIEVHLIQNHAPSNLNRDDTGSPKEAFFGGVKRARISSQCLKRTIRRSEMFQTALAGNLGTRTRQLPEEIRKAFESDPELKPYAEVAAKKASGFGTKDGKERDADPKSGKFLTAQTMFLTPADIEAVAEVLKKAARESKNLAAFEKLTAKDLQSQAQAKGFRPISVDVALFGRMVTSEALRDVEACCQVAHPISTHKIAHEFDYFTAVDDLQGLSEAEGEEDSGADMIGDVEYNSACYYKYLSLDLDGLVDNLTGKKLQEVTEESLASAKELAKKTIAAMVEAAVMTTPSGKQNTFAAHQLPAAVLVEVRPVKTPISYANAFVDPVRAGKDGKDLVTGSLTAFGEHVAALTDGFNLKTSKRLLLAPLHKDWSIEGTEKVKSLAALLSALDEAL